MINLGFTSSIKFARLSPEIVQMTIHLQTGMDTLPNPYYLGATTDVCIFLNQEQYDVMRKEINELDDDNLILSLPDDL